jgi:hypothetical protein
MRNILLLVAASSYLFAQVREKDVALGYQVASQMETHQKLIHDAEVQAFADRVLEKLSLGRALRVPLGVKVIDNVDINVASTLSGGVLLISSGGILRSDSEAEFAALLAHAMAHSQIGPVSSSGQVGGIEIPLIFLGGPWGFCNRSWDSTAHTRLMPARAVQAELTEAQADLLGLGYLVNGGYDPHALISGFEHGSGKLRPDEGLKEKADSLMKMVANPVVDTSAFEQMKTRLVRQPSLYK